jgi:hypothetical protein
MIHDAQEHCYRWEELCQRHYQELPTDIDRDRAKRELHVAVMSYLRQLSRFKHEKQAQEYWQEDVVFKANGEALTLADVFAADGYRWSGHSSAVDGEVESHAKTMSIPQLMEVLSKADQIANALKFDAEPGEYVAEPGDARV